MQAQSEHAMCLRPGDHIGARGRYKVVKVLNSTIYGKALLCVDTDAVGPAAGQPQYQVVLKESTSAAMQKRQTESIVAVGEDVFKEAKLMRYLGVCFDSPGTARAHSADGPDVRLRLLPAHIDRCFNGLSPAYWRRNEDHSTGHLCTEALQRIARGAQFIAPLHDEFIEPVACENAEKAPFTHYMSVAHASGGDLFDFLLANEFDEAQARVLFRQVVQGVMYAHARGVAHLDLSTENICLHKTGSAGSTHAGWQPRIIDWGLGFVHSTNTAATMGGVHAATLDPVARLRPVAVPGETGALCAEADASPCSACRRPVSELNAQFLKDYVSATETLRHLNRLSVGSRADPCLATCQSFSHQQMITEAEAVARATTLVRPVCRARMVPGKNMYTAPELANVDGSDVAWDPFAADVYSLGCVLFTLLTNHRPYTQPDTSCGWWKMLVSGSWLLFAPGSGAVKHADRVSLQARHLITLCMQPAPVRPRVDQLLQHPWLSDSA
jgi:serine/threonine protein kinase